MTRALCLLLLLACALASAADRPGAAPPAGRIAIIIDDVGYSFRLGLQAVELPGAVTLSVLPHTPAGATLAQLGHRHGKEIMLHAPMTNLQRLPLDAGGLTDDMREHTFNTTLADGLRSIPHVRGVNNHMGSYLTQLETPMQWLMQQLASEGLFFIDSRTSAASVAHRVALQHQVPSRKRDVFLDNERDHSAIARQFAQLLTIARERGNALAIGHPYPETLRFLSRALPRLPEQGIELISASELLRRYPARLQPVTAAHSTENRRPVRQ